MACKEVVLFFVPQAIVNNLLCHFRFQIFMVFIHEYICLSIKTLQDLLKPRMHLFFYLQSINIFRRRLKLITLYNSVKIKVEQIYCTFYTLNPFLVEKSDCVGKYVPFTSKSLIENRYNDLLSNKSGTRPVRVFLYPYTRFIYTFCNGSSHSLFLRQQNQNTVRINNGLSYLLS